MDFHSIYHGKAVEVEMIGGDVYVEVFNAVDNVDDVGAGASVGTVVDVVVGASVGTGAIVVVVGVIYLASDSLHVVNAV